MTQHNATSASITNRDASPRVANTAGVGGPSQYTVYEDYVTVPASADTTSVFRILRVPSNAVVKDLFLESEAQTVGVVNVGVWYPDNANDVAGGSGLDTGAVISANFFASLLDIGSAVAKENIINESGTNTMAKRQQPLWQAIGLTSDPGGFLDIVAQPSTSITTGLGKLGLCAQVVLP